MTGTFFIGIKQFDQDPLNIGFDVNTVTNSKMYYSNSGADWNKSLTKGALMIRPIFSSNLNKHIGLQEVSNMESQSIQLYPNPTQEFISITSTYEGYDGGILRDIHGKIVMQITHNQSTISMIDLPAGIYLFQDKITGQTYKISKL